MKNIRMKWTGLFALAFIVFVLASRPEQVYLFGWKLALIATAGWIGYWLDRELYPYARPHEASAKEQPLVMIRRAIIVGSAMVAAGIAV